MANKSEIDVNTVGTSNSKLNLGSANDIKKIVNAKNILAAFFIFIL